MTTNRLHLKMTTNIKNIRNESVVPYGCFAHKTPILKYDCTIVPIEKLKVGDTLIGSDSEPVKIIKIYNGSGKMYRVDQANGLSYTVNENYMLILKSVNYPEETSIEMSINKYIKLPVAQREKLLGFKTQITSLKYNNSYVNEATYELEKMYEYGTTLAKLQVNIPQQFKYCSIELKLQLLAGIVDTIGKLSDDFYELSSDKKPFVDDVIFLARSIGFRTFLETKY